MKIFLVSYHIPGLSSRGTHVVCEESAEIPNLIAKRHDTAVENVENLMFREVSPEQVLIKDLSVADFLRLTK